MSRPPRARGLKLNLFVLNLKINLSRPPRARGLKQAWRTDLTGRREVAPPAGAWIETAGGKWDGYVCASRPPRARGLKLWQVITVPPESVSRPPRARGLKRMGFAELSSGL